VGALLNYFLAALPLSPLSVSLTLAPSLSVSYSFILLLMANYLLATPSPHKGTDSSSPSAFFAKAAYTADLPRRLLLRS
jgi:hypothetical protein